MYFPLQFGATKVSPKNSFFAWQTLTVSAYQELFVHNRWQSRGQHIFSTLTVRKWRCQAQRYLTRVKLIHPGLLFSMPRCPNFLLSEMILNELRFCVRTCAWQTRPTRRKVGPARPIHERAEQRICERSLIYISSLCTHSTGFLTQSWMETLPVGAGQLWATICHPIHSVEEILVIFAFVSKKMLQRSLISALLLGLPARVNAFCWLLNLLVLERGNIWWECIFYF
jgi:hypothetical protein